MNRRSFLLAILSTAILWVSFAGFVWLTAPQLPDRVAVHFGAHGQPNGWMTRDQHVLLFLAAGLGVPTLVLGIFALIRRLQGRGLNVPNKEYWLAPERRQETLDFILRQGFWYAGLFTAFFAAIHWSIVMANRQAPVSLPATLIAWIASGFLSASAVWMGGFFWYFLRKPA
jgi:uncharacterized membrane protein